MQPQLADSEHPRAYGANYVYCKGCGITGPDRRTALVSLGMILIPSVAFMIWTSPWFYSHFGVAVPLTQALLVLFTVYFFLITACSDPGILPRHRSPLNAFDPLTGAYRVRQPPRYQDVVINGNSIRLKFCTTCNIYRPPRSVHCAICDNCVERFDHHCPWLGNCIGLRNYRTFVFFVIFCSLLSVFSFVSSAVKVAFVVVWLREEGLTGDEVFHQLWGKATESILLLVYTFVLSWFVLALLAYHGYLISTNQTTYEQIKSFFYESNPWSKGLVGNLADVFCRPVRARYFNPLKPALCFLEEDDLVRSPSPINKDLSGDSARDTPSPLAAEESAYLSGTADLDVPLSQRPFANRRSQMGARQAEKAGSSSGEPSECALSKDPRSSEDRGDRLAQASSQPPDASPPSAALATASGAPGVASRAEHKPRERLKAAREESGLQTSEEGPTSEERARQKADEKSGREARGGGSARAKGGRRRRDLHLSEGPRDDGQAAESAERRETTTPVAVEPATGAGTAGAFRTKTPAPVQRTNPSHTEDTSVSRTPQSLHSRSSNSRGERRPAQEANSSDVRASGPPPARDQLQGWVLNDCEVPAVARQRFMVTTAVVGRPADFHGNREGVEMNEGLASEETPTVQSLSLQPSSSSSAESSTPSTPRTTPGEALGKKNTEFAPLESVSGRAPYPEESEGTARGNRGVSPPEDGHQESVASLVSSRPGRRVVPSPKRTDQGSRDGDYLVCFKSETSSSRYSSHWPRSDGKATFPASVPEARENAQGGPGSPREEAVPSFFTTSREEEKIHQVLRLNQEEETGCSCFPSPAPTQRGSAAGVSSKGKVRSFSSGGLSAFRLFSSCFVAVPTPWARSRETEPPWSDAHPTPLQHSRSAEISAAASSHSLPLSRLRISSRRAPPHSAKVSPQTHSKPAGLPPPAVGTGALPRRLAPSVEAESSSNVGLDDALDGASDNSESGDLGDRGNRARSAVGKACRCLSAGERQAVSREPLRPHESSSCAVFAESQAERDLETGRLPMGPSVPACPRGVAHVDRATSCLGGKRMKDLVLRCGAIACVLPDEEDEDDNGVTVSEAQGNTSDTFRHVLRDAPSFLPSARAIISQRWSDGAVALGERRESAMYDRAKNQGYNSGEIFGDAATGQPSPLLGSAAFDKE